MAKSMVAANTFRRLIRFIPTDATHVRIGEPLDTDQDVGLAMLYGDEVHVQLFSGSSVLKAGDRTGQQATVGKLLSPLAANEAGTIRCIGLNYLRHANEMKLQVPEVPPVFLKPSTSVADPYPTASSFIPKHVVKDDAADYESEVAVVIGSECKNASEETAMEYVLGYTAVNDISSRLAQFAQSQWCYSKGFDGACPLGPALVNKNQVDSLDNLELTGSYNGKMVQKSKLDDLIFSIPKIVSFLSQGTTLPAGTVILTGTPAGVGWSCSPRITLHEGDEFRVWVSHGVGTLVNRFAEEH